jgi:hypothetical protein
MSADASDAERNAEHWRKLEAEARGTKTDPEPRRIMLFIAEGYKLLANRAGLRNVPKH